MNELEEEFKMVLHLNKNTIDAKIANAKQLIADAKELADECGMPIEIGIEEDYIYEPEKFRTKYKYDVYNENIVGLLGFDPFVPFGSDNWNDDEDDGWNSSSYSC